MVSCGAQSLLQPPGAPHPPPAQSQLGAICVPGSATGKCLRSTPAGFGQDTGTSPAALRGLPGVALDVCGSLSNNPPSPKAAVEAGGRRVRQGCLVARLSSAVAWGAGFSAEGSFPFSLAWHSPFLSLAKTKPSVWDAALKVSSAVVAEKPVKSPSTVTL